jgi:hypothetical protein
MMISTRLPTLLNSILPEPYRADDYSAAQNQSRLYEIAHAAITLESAKDRYSGSRSAFNSDWSIARRRVQCLHFPRLAWHCRHAAMGTGRYRDRLCGAVFRWV